MIRRVHLDAVPEATGSRYPEPFRQLSGEVGRKRLGDALGLSRLGVTWTRNPPGQWASQRHAHSDEDEFFLVLEGTPTLVSDAGEQQLEPGDLVGAAAGEPDAHCFRNDSDRDCVLLAVGNRSRADRVTYPDIDMQTTDDRYRTDRSPWIRPDGTPF